LVRFYLLLPSGVNGKYSLTYSHIKKQEMPPPPLFSKSPVLHNFIDKIETIFSEYQIIEEFRVQERNVRSWGFGVGRGKEGFGVQEKEGCGGGKDSV
jgi:hypothetical protein